MPFPYHNILGTAYQYFQTFVSVASLELDMIPSPPKKLPWLKSSGTKFQQSMKNNVKTALFDLVYILTMSESFLCVALGIWVLEKL